MCRVCVVGIVVRSVRAGYGRTFVSVLGSPSSTQVIVAVLIHGDLNDCFFFDTLYYISINVRLKH